MKRCNPLKSHQGTLAEENSGVICATCGKAVAGKWTDVHEKRIVEFIDDRCYNFDSNDCVLMFKKFRNVYGTSFIEI